MIDIVEILPPGTFPPNQAVDTVTLDHDDRVRRRIVMTSAGGVAMRLNQARPVSLRHGCGLQLADGRIVRVAARPEALLEIHAHDLEQLVRIAWHLGNRHLPTQLLGEVLRIREDHVIAEMVEGLGGHVYKVRAAFDPEGGAYSGGHGHGDHRHDHGHPHAHGPHG